MKYSPRYKLSVPLTFEAAVNLYRYTLFKFNEMYRLNKYKMVYEKNNGNIVIPLDCASRGYYDNARAGGSSAGRGGAAEGEGRGRHSHPPAAASTSCSPS